MEPAYTRATILELKWGSSAEHRKLARMAGMNALDIEYIAEICLSRHVMIIMRSPKRASRIFDGGLIDPKPPGVKEKTDRYTGTVERAVRRAVDPVTGKESVVTRTYISDYDLMSVWKGPGRPYAKLFFSETARGELSAEALSLLRELNQGLIRKIQHGANDDWLKDGKPRNPHIGFDSFIVWRVNGSVEFKPSKGMLQQFYRDNGLHWPY
ncbi:hypothetical protein [Roseicella aerolata]|uniref:Uncharacterized protein n=1 Tax=Roseicella aerolata TaxID=2883479 RepID=A0A9X1LAY5_9PROT|nr:hypothetical protein [Roseicella aerolata]MCB4821917.1 hypothetical protein [Roseicella aerolata]